MRLLLFLLLFSIPAGASSGDRLSLSATALLDFSRASVSYDTESSKGWGMGAGLRFTLPVGRFRLIGGIGYQQILISHSLDGSASLQNENPTPVHQSIGYLVPSFSLGYRFTSVWGWEVGVGYYVPFTARQSIRTGEGENFSAPDRLFLGTTGLWAEFPLTPEWYFSSQALFFYHLSAAQGSFLAGVRLGVALGLCL